MLNQLSPLLLFAAWAALWIVGGWLILRGAFHVGANEQIPLALLAGFVIDTVLANMLGQVLPLPLAFWLAAVLVLLLGVALAWGKPWKDLLRIPFRPVQVLVLLVLTGVFSLAERGAPMFDDYAHLPTLSLIATGDIPPHFAYNADVMYYYHYFLMLFAAQLTRIGDLRIWTSLDVARALAFAITVLLSALWARRLTKSTIAGVLGGAFAMFGMGTRWLLLLLPPGIIAKINPYVTIIGSSLTSGKTLSNALWNFWGVEGMGPVTFPFAFANGINTPGVVAISGPNSITVFGVTLFLLLTFNRWRSWRGGVVSALVIASLALLYEVEIALSLAAWGLLVLFVLLKQKSFRQQPGLLRRIPASLWAWLSVIAAGNLLGAFQGGAFTDILLGFLRQLQGQNVESYQTVGFAFSLAPTIVSAHLGVLNLLNPVQLFVALLEIGPVILILPLLGVWGVKAYRAERWFEVSLILSAFLSLVLLFVQFVGSPGIRNSSRLYSFVWICGLYAVPLAWIWASRRSETWKWISAVLLGAAMFGGLVMMQVKLVSIQRPVLSSYLTRMDGYMYDRYWNQLEPEARIFDPDLSRVATVFGRPTLGGLTWFSVSEDLIQLESVPRPTKLRAAGYYYVYMAEDYFASLPEVLQQELTTGCSKLVDEAKDNFGNFRRLYDIKDCR